MKSLSNSSQEPVREKTIFCITVWFVRYFQLFPVNDRFSVGKFRLFHKQDEL